MPFASCCNSSHAEWFSETWVHWERNTRLGESPFHYTLKCCRKRHENIVESSRLPKLCLSHMSWNREVGTSLPHLPGTVHFLVFLCRMKQNGPRLQPKQIHFWDLGCHHKSLSVKMRIPKTNISETKTGKVWMCILPNLTNELLVQLFFLLLKPFCHILCLVFQSLVQSVLGILGFWRHESFQNGRFGGCFFGGTNTTTETYSLMMFFLVGCGYKNKIGSWSLSKSTYMKLKLLGWQWDWDRNWLKKTLQSS